MTLTSRPHTVGDFRPDSAGDSAPPQATACDRNHRRRSAGEAWALLAAESRLCSGDPLHWCRDRISQWRSGEDPSLGRPRVLGLALPMHFRSRQVCSAILASREAFRIALQVPQPLPLSDYF